MRERVFRKRIEFAATASHTIGNVSPLHFTINLPEDFICLTGVLATASVKVSAKTQTTAEAAQIHLEAEGEMICDMTVHFDAYDGAIGFFPGVSLFDQGYNINAGIKRLPLTVKLSQNVSVVTGYVIPVWDFRPYTVNIYFYYQAAEKT